MRHLVLPLLAVLFFLGQSRTKAQEQRNIGGSTPSSSTGGGFLQGVESCYGKNYTQAEYNNCLLKEINTVAPQLTQGVPELDIPKLDPLILKNINLVQTEPPVAINAEFQSIRVSGISKMQVKYIDVPFAEPRIMKMGFVIPVMLMRGQYEISGQIFALPISGNGNFISKLETLVVEAQAEIVPDYVNNKSTVENVVVHFKIRDMNTKLDNLFEGNKVMADTIHHFMKENGQLLLDELRPELSKTIDGLIKTLMEAMFLAAPASLAQSHGVI